MERIKRLTIWSICVLMGLESIIFVNAGFFDQRRYQMIGGSDGPTSLFIYRPGQNPYNRFPFFLDNKEIEEPPPDLSAQIHREAEERGLLVLVNKQHSLDAVYKPEDLEPIDYFATDRSRETRFMRAEAAEEFNRLVEEAAEDGYTLVMTTAYRSFGFQKILWDNYVATEGEEAAARFSAKPGQSEHQTGLAVDVTSPSVDFQLSTSFGDTKEGIWLAENAHRFGFILRYPPGKEVITGYQYEPWHLRYVGIDVATYMHQKGLTLEEYLQ
jgi:D-alanyl-D-alanine carboxypeptidase